MIPKMFFNLCFFEYFFFTIISHVLVELCSYTGVQFDCSQLRVFARRSIIRHKDALGVEKKVISERSRRRKGLPTQEWMHPCMDA